jgi:hypothetical protein
MEMKKDSEDETKGKERCKPKEEKWSRRKERHKIQKRKEKQSSSYEKNKETIIRKLSKVKEQ